MSTPYRVVVYINGVRIFPMSVSVNAQRNQFLSFTVDVPAVPEWELLQPRSHGAVFFVDPVTLKWRLMCEGEFMAKTRVKDQAGQRSRGLQFRGLHGTFDTSNYMSTGATLTSGTVSQTLSVLANGRKLTPACADAQDTHLSLMTLIGATTAGQFSPPVFFPSFVKYCMLQLPVEAYYYYARRLEQKTFALSDTTIIKIIDAALFEQLAQGGISENKLQRDTPITQIINWLEGIIYYQHIPVLAPPLYNLTSQLQNIPELLHTPQIYTVIPPACNVIFQDQITQMNDSDNFATQPTRVILQSSLGSDASAPSFHVATSPRIAYNVGTAASVYQGSPGTLPTHALLSQDELQRGVVPRHVPFDIFRKESGTPSRSPAVDLENYLTQVARWSYVETTGESQPLTISCAFLPFLLPGAPALVEDYSGPMHAFIESVTHILPATSSPQTIVNMTFAKAAYLKDGHGERMPYPSWLSEYFQAEAFTKGVTGTPTWELLLGLSQYQENGEYLSALAPRSVIQKATQALGEVETSFSTTYDASQVIDRDRVAAYVVPIPSYNKDWKAQPPVTTTIAEKLRKQTDVPAAMYEYNWRPGVSLSQYLAFHKLEVRADIDNGLEDPPEFLFSDPRKGKALFCSPGGLDYKCATGNILAVFAQPVDVDSADANLGIYTLTANAAGERIDSAKQQVMVAIADALKRAITRS